MPAAAAAQVDKVKAASCRAGFSTIASGAIATARVARRRALENFAFSAVYNLVAAPAAMLGLVNPFIAALAMSGSSILVSLNALRTRAGGADR